MDLQLSIEDDADGTGAPGAEIESLRQFLRTDDELRGVDIEQHTTVAAEGAMGPITDALMLTFGAGGIGVTVIEAVSAWLKSRRSNVKVKVSSGSRTVEIAVSSTSDPAKVVELLRAIEAT
ncbi:MAG TPA: hypothetical protein VKB69_16995 [Micromonosporaceae bacterium]|nr:hypothetical protein [Micromonosporaceae bacterium]